MSVKEKIEKILSEILSDAHGRKIALRFESPNTERMARQDG